jgi:pimeloyl-ACP methyl ester carboxylesterase
MQRIPVGETDLEVEVRGSGEPVVLIPTALMADELLPMADQPPLRDRYRLILYRRRGYGGSAPAAGRGSIERDARDCDALLAALGVEHAHVVGVSYSAAIALQLAATKPDGVHSLILIEPPPRHVPSAPEFIEANNQLLDHHRTDGALQALDRFLTGLMGIDWRKQLDRHLPGSVQQVESDADTFFNADIPALLSWEFGLGDANRISQPVLYVGGSASGPWFAEVRDLLLEWLPHAEDVVIAGADHSLAVTHPRQTAEAVAGFLERHPIW